MTIADALVENTFNDGDTICTQGEVGDAFYIIKEVRRSYWAVRRLLMVYPWFS